MNISRVIRLDSETSNTLAYMHSYRLTLHAFNYMVLTYGYFSLQIWDNDYCPQNELVIPQKGK